MKPHRNAERPPNQKVNRRKNQNPRTANPINLSRKGTSFRLQTSKDCFYQDFVCKLKDGRILAVEYKGGHLFDGIDSEEKRAVGAIWESRSEGRCLFVMPTGGDFSTVAAKIGKPIN